MTPNDTRLLEQALRYLTDDGATMPDADGPATAALIQRLVEDSARLAGLRRLCGYVENGSDTSVSMFQDDATREWFVRVGSPQRGKMPFHGTSMGAALDAAIAGTPKEDWET